MKKNANREDEERLVLTAADEVPFEIATPPAEEESVVADNGQGAMDNGQWTMDNGQWTARREATLDTSRMDNVPVAEVEVPEKKARSAWKVLSSEDLPQVSLREILGGDYLLGSIIRKNIGFILLLVLLGIIYISNRYAAQQEIIEEMQKRKELVETKNYALTQYALLTQHSRQSALEQRLRALGDSLLLAPKEPPFVIKVEKLKR